MSYEKHIAGALQLTTEQGSTQLAVVPDTTQRLPCEHGAAWHGSAASGTPTAASTMGRGPTLASGWTLRFGLTLGCEVAMSRAEPLAVGLALPLLQADPSSANSPKPQMRDGSMRKRHVHGPGRRLYT
jgi:hypothetical protein